MHPLLFLGFVLSFLLPVAHGVDASCNLIPSTLRTFRGAQGAANKPFAAPGDFVEVNPIAGSCTATVNPLDPPATSADFDVTVVFTPPEGGPARVVFLTENCGAAAAKQAQCGAVVGANNVACVGASNAAKAIVPRLGVNHLSFRFPDSDSLIDGANDDRTLTGPVTIAITDTDDPLPCDLATTLCKDKPGLVACIGDLYETDGSCTPNPHPVFSRFTALPVPNDYQAGCFADAPPCNPTAPETRAAVDAAGNLLVPVNWQGVLVKDGNVPVPRLLRDVIKSPIQFLPPTAVSLQSFTPEGARLPPIFEPQIDPSTTATNVVALFGSADASYSILRIARGLGACKSGTKAGSACVTSDDCDEACATEADCCQRVCNGGTKVGDPCTKDSQCKGGGRCATLFEDFRPLPLVSGGGPLVLPRFAPAEIGGICQLDTNTACDTNADCAADMSGPCVGYALEARTPVPLEGLTGSDELFTFSIRETILNEDLNGDEDEVDLVQTLQDRTTGQQLFIGEGDAPGRAVATIEQAPFSSPAVAADGDVVAFLEAEGAQGDVEAPLIINSDGDSLDTFLRVFRVDRNSAGAATGTSDLTASFAKPRVADAALVVNGRSLAVSDDKVFARILESGGVSEKTTRISLDSAGNELPPEVVPGVPNYSESPNRGPSISPTGRFVMFITRGAILPLQDQNNNPDAYLYDRDKDQNGVFDEPGEDSTGYILASAAENGTPISTEFAAISQDRDARFLVFRVDAGNVAGSFVGGVPGSCPNRTSNPVGNCAVTMVHDRVANTTEPVSVGLLGEVPNGESFLASISADGRFAAFISNASNLVADDGTEDCGGPPGSCSDVFVHDRCLSFGTSVPNCAPSTAKVLRSDGSQTTQAPQVGEPVQISADGSTIVFASLEQMLVGEPVLSDPAAWIVDRATGAIELASRGLTGQIRRAEIVSVSGDGRYVAFSSTGDLVPGDAPSASKDVYRFDRVTRAFQRVSARPVLPEVGESHPAQISLDGRFVVFVSTTPNTVPGDDNQCDADGNPGLEQCPDVFVADTLLRTIKRISLPAGGGQPDGNPALRVLVGISGDGRTATFSSVATNLVPGDTNGISDVFMRTLDWQQAPANDVTGDGDIDDTVLAVVDGATGALAAADPIFLCPADKVSVANGKAAFIRPAFSGATPDTACLGASSSSDRVYLWSGNGSAVDAGLNGSAVALSATHIAAISDAGTLNVRAVDGGGWTDTLQFADAIQFCDDTIVFSHAAGNGVPTVRLYVPTVGLLPAVFTGARDVVCSDRIVALRVREAEAGGPSANDDTPTFGDVDTADDVLKTYDLSGSGCRTPQATAACIGTSKRAVQPCRFEACDPLLPYRVVGDTVRFLTRELEQGNHDLNGDGDANDVVISTFDVVRNAVTVVATPDPETDTDPLAVPPASKGDDPSVVYSSTGRCIELGGACPCTGEGFFCESGECRREQGVCANDDECPPGILCDTSAPIVPASPDTDADGVPDHGDNCPTKGNADQADLDADGVGDECDRSTCGDGVVAYDEQCEASNSASCPGNCDANCACPTCETPMDAKAVVAAKTRKEAGALSLKATLPITDLTEPPPFAIRIEDGNSGLIDETRLPAIPQADKKKKRFVYKSKTGVVRMVVLQRKNLDLWGVKVLTKGQFTAVELGETASEIRVTLSIGPQCFSKTLDKIID